MHVMIGDRIYSSNDEPILVFFDSSENVQFRASAPATDIFCSWPQNWDRKVGEAWMKANEARLVAASKPMAVTPDNLKRLEEIRAKLPEFKFVDGNKDGSKGEKK